MARVRPALQMVVVLAAVGLSLASGSPRKIVYTPGTTTAHPAKPAECHISVVTATPLQPYEEIGVFDIDYAGTQGDAQLIKSTTELEKILGPRACAVGADALIASTFPGSATIVRAVAVRWKAPAPATQPTAPPVEVTSEVDAGPADDATPAD